MHYNYAFEDLNGRRPILNIQGCKMGCLVGQSHKRPFGNLSNIILKKKLNFVQGRKLNVTTFSNFLSYKYVYNISMNIQYVILGCVLVLFILLATGLSCGALPYSSTATYTKYEGFRKSTFHDKLRTLYRQLNRQKHTKEFYADELRLIRKAINERDYNAEAAVDAVRRIFKKTKGIKGIPGIGDSVARQLTRDFLNWYDEAHIIIKTNDNIEASEEAAAAARCHLIENKAFRNNFAYLFDLFLFFFKTDANCFRSERQRCNAIVDAINHG